MALRPLLATVSAAAFAIGTLAAAGEVATYAPVTAERLANPEPGNWLSIRRTYDGQSHSPLDQINAGNVKDLKVVWNSTTGPRQKLTDFAALPAGAHAPLAEFRSRTHGAAAAVGYGKAAMLFVMLQDRIGEAAFREGIRSFWARQRFRTAGWGELQAAFEGASGQALGPFFEAWLNQRALPAVRIESAITAAVNRKSFKKV